VNPKKLKHRNLSQSFEAGRPCHVAGHFSW